MNPTECPRCGSAKHTQNRQNPDGSGFWRCNVCGYLWSQY